MERLDLGGGVKVPVSEVEWRFSSSGGPGGQHANRASTRVEARLDLVSSPSLPDRVRERLVNAFGADISVTVDEERSQARNRTIALERLEQRLAAALVPRKRRKPTRPSRASKRRRLEEKRRRSDVKQQRKPPAW